MQSNVTPVLLGADLNCYSMARAFHEAYGVISHAFGKCKLGAIKYSSIIKFHKIPPLDQKEQIMNALIDFAKNRDDKPYIFGCTDEYALFIIENKAVLSKYFACPSPSACVAQKYSDKTLFYEKCDELFLPHPKTVVVPTPDDAYLLGSLPFDYPVIIKPACSHEYWHHPFDNMRKVYVAHYRADGERIISDIFESGYGKNILIQEKVNYTYQYVATCLSEKGKITAACVGRVLLGEITPKGLGNHVAIITEKNDEVFDMVESFLSSVQYDGFSNFDILRDDNTGKYYLLEINLRQGRSNYYMSAAGMNLARLAVEGYDGASLCENEIFWHSVPTKIVLDRCSEADGEKIRSLISSNRAFSSLEYKADMKSPLRLAYLAVHNAGFYRKYRADDE